MQNKKIPGSLVLVGSGIKFLSHLTTEAKLYIERADKVLYLLNEPAMQQWVQKTNSTAESLDPLYIKYPLRSDCYKAITDYILETLYKQQNVCVVLYGHPTVFAEPGLNAVIQARKVGYDARALPGISAEDCLFADLLINPGSCGCQSFEATDFLVYGRKWDPNSHLLLWQVGIIGILEHTIDQKNSKALHALVQHLNKYYLSNHEVILYEAAQYTGFEAKIYKFPLEQLPSTIISRTATLYVPPAKRSQIKKGMLKTLGIEIPLNK